MTARQRRHLSRIVAEAGARIAAKYQRGALEHGGNLWEKPATDLLEEAIDEAVDQLVYLLTLRETITCVKNPR